MIVCCPLGSKQGADGVTGFEPTIRGIKSRCFNQLSYTPLLSAPKGGGQKTGKPEKKSSTEEIARPINDGCLLPIGCRAATAVVCCPKGRVSTRQQPSGLRKAFLLRRKNREKCFELLATGEKENGGEKEGGPPPSCRRFAAVRGGGPHLKKVEKFSLL